MKRRHQILFIVLSIILIGIGVSAEELDITISRNMKAHDWYISQMNTGEYSDINCVLTTGVMAIRWAFSNNNLRVEDIRNESSNKGEWTVEENIKLMRDNDLIVFEENLKGKQQIREMLDKGYIIQIVGSNKYLGYGSGAHSLLVHDYFHKDGKMYYITHDPFSEDSRRLGKNKVYLADDITNSLLHHYNKIVIIVDPNKKVEK